MARGWISGENPLTFDPQDTQYTANGLTLFLCQVVIILSLCYILGNVFQRVGQPRVVGELLAGVVLGPTAFGNIPGFSQTIVPTSSLSLLKLMSNIGLVFFILLVGLETDTELIKRYARQVALIALPGMAVPFAISVGLAKFVFEQSTDQSQSFTTFFLFVSTVMAVTSLSVLSRVISELKLLNTVLGSVTIAAGALNDLIGYVLLALGSALGSGGKQINALYQLLVAFALFLLQWFVVRPVLFWLIGRTSFDMSGASRTRVPDHLLVITLLGALISAFITDACNLHPILGALLFGIACPHDNFAVMITEEIETISVGVLLPLYFVTSGLNANFKLLNTGLIWGQIVLIFFVVFISKFVATAVCTRIAGFKWRDAAFVAALMQSKSIIELIILNAGQEIGVLSPQVYSMLFMTFIFSTLTVRPLAAVLYKRDMESEESHDTPSSGMQAKEAATENEKSTAKAKLERQLCVSAAITSDNPAVEALMALMKIAGVRSMVDAGAEASPPKSSSSLLLDIVRFVPNDNSKSTILRMLHQHKDKMLEVLRFVGHMHGVEFLQDGASVQAASHARFAEMITVNNSTDIVSATRARLDTISRMLSSKSGKSSEDELGNAVVVVPWESNAHLAPLADDVDHPSGRLNALTSASMFAKASTVATELFHCLKEHTTGVTIDSRDVDPNPEVWWNRHYASKDPLRAQEARLGLSMGTHRKARVIVPFFGGSDDRACVEMAKVLAKSPAVEAIIVAVDRAQLSTNIIKELQSAVGLQGTSSDTADGDGVAEEHGNLSHSGINLATINIPTVEMREEEHADARKLFHRPSSSEGEGKEPTVQGETVSQGASPNEDLIVQRVDNVTFVALRASFVQSTTATKTHVEAVMSYVAPMLDARAGDIVLAGRGKLQQRSSDFRLQVQALADAVQADLSQQQEQQKQHRQQGRLRQRGASTSAASAADVDRTGPVSPAAADGSHATANDRAREVAKMGTVLGACCEAILTCKLSANVIVLQSGSGTRR